MKIVINTCHGGFELSKAAVEEYCKRKGIEKVRTHDIPRDDPDLITIVETMGDLVNSYYSELKVVNIPDDVKWQIEENNGDEWIAEQHRVWSS